jgi:vancomycin resistance protein YoaR
LLTVRFPRLDRLPRPNSAGLIAIGVVLAAIVAMVGFGAAYAYAGDVPRGTTILGIDVGGMGRAEAEAALTKGLAQRTESLAAPVPVQIGEAATEIRPEAVGLAVDVPASVARAASGNPMSALFGGREVPPVVTVDPERLDEALRDTADEVSESMTMPAIEFDGTIPVPVYPEPGLGLDPERTAEAVTAAWPAREPSADGWVEPPVITVPLVEINPVTTAGEVDRLIAELAKPAVAAPVTVELPDRGTLTVSPEVIADSLQLDADSRGEIIPEVDPEALREGMADQLAKVETQPVDAHFVTEGDSPRIVDSDPGELVETEQLATNLLEVLADAEPRRVAAEVVTVEAEVTSADLEQLGVTEQVSTFTTDFEGGLSEPRSQNIVRVAEIVDGALVQPGEVFSLNGFTGERGYEQGFVDAPVILNGRLQPGVGGGISQFTTTLFNAAYYAGLQDVEHWPHSYWYSRYPSVIEATIFYPTLDLKFRNNTPYGILIDTSYTSGSVTVSMWSTRVWDEVTTEWGAKRDVTEPPTRYIEPGPTCIDTQGIDGFRQDAWRVFHQDGGEVTREKFSWRYDPQPQFICGEKPDRDQ